MRLIAICLSLILLMGASHAALREEDRPLGLAAIQYGHENLQANAGLVKDARGIPSLAESSIGYVTACLVLGQDLEQAKLVLGRMLDHQQTTGPEAGNFSWESGSASSPDAILYMAPLLSIIYREVAGQLDEALRTRLRQSLELALSAVSHLQFTPTDDIRFLQRAAALASLGAALGIEGPGTAAGQVATWLNEVGRQGLPQGHSPTLDAVRFMALKWIYEVISESMRPVVERALVLVATDMALRLHPSLPGLAGTQTSAFPNDYLAAPNLATYVLYTDFGYPRPHNVEPYIMAMLLPAWRTPQNIRQLTETPLPRLVRTTGHTATTTLLAPGFSLSTCSGEVGSSSIPLFATFAGPGQRPSVYAFCDPPPAHVQALQDGDLALCSFNFDNLGQGSRKQASVRLILGHAEDIGEVYCYSQAWNDLPTSLGERESLAVALHGCYLGLTLTRVGEATSQAGSPAKPASLRWSGEGRQGDLTLQVYARQADYALRAPIHDVRAGFVVTIVPQAAYPTLADFVRYLEAGRLKQNVRSYKQRQLELEKPREPGVMNPYPTSKEARVYRTFVEQTTEYVNGERSLKLVEDVRGEETLQAFINGQELKRELLWDAPGFSLKPNSNLSEALAPLLKP